jgi:Tfp pilus assembly protein PilF
MQVRWLVLVVFACSSSKESKPETGSAPAPAVSVDAAVAAVKPAPVAKPAPAKPHVEKVKPGTKLPDDPKARAAYGKAMSTGRKATDAKKYPDAIAAFDSALVAKPNDARALAERGYAKLLQGSDLDAASRDFDAAAARTSNTKLLSMIWFNRGLAEDKRGNSDNAIAAFQRANQLRPSAAAKAKLKKPVCPIQVDHEVPADYDGKPFSVVSAATWLELWKALPHEDLDAPTTEADAIQKLTDSTDAPQLPLIGTPRVDIGSVAVVVWKQGGKLHGLVVGKAQGGRCAGFVNFDVVAATADKIHIHGNEESEGGYEFMCRPKGSDDIEECSGAPGETDAGTACMGGEVFARDVVIDMTGKVLLVVEEDVGKESVDDKPVSKVKISLAAGGLKLAGDGCDRTEPFAK